MSTRSTSRTAGEEYGVGASPAIQTRVSRFCGTIQQDPAQQQEWQIVQS
jgi:hypothetical protein